MGSGDVSEPVIANWEYGLVDPQVIGCLAVLWNGTLHLQKGLCLGSESSAGKQRRQ